MPEQDTYRSIEKSSKGIFKDRGSKFLAFAFPVYSENEIKSILGNIRKEYHDARHHCYAYRLGSGKIRYRANDDGEPSSSAGKPILTQIQVNDLSNIMIIVVRYFGGTLLGVGGLINAYRSAAADAIKNAIIVAGIESDHIIIRFPYEQTNDIMKIIDEEKMKIRDQEFTQSCKLEVLIRKSRTKQVVERLRKLQGTCAEQAD